MACKGPTCAKVNTMREPPLAEAALAPVALEIELGGRLNNIGKLKHWFMAIAEVVQNSMDSLELSGRPGNIHVTIIREADLLGAMKAEAPITAIRVVDEGVGFNSENFKSFCTPDSAFKRLKGGKGLGRLMCLQAFERLAVDSCYMNGQSLRRRRAVLKQEKPELVANDAAVEGTQSRTVVELQALRARYASFACASGDLVVDWLTEHFLPVLVERPTWLLSLTVEDGNSKSDLLSLVSARAAWKESFQIRNYNFSLTCYAVSKQSKAERVRLVAGGRIVDSNTQPVEHYLPHLRSISEDKPHLVLVHSPFFDEHVNDARNGVSFADDMENQLLGVTAAEFRTACGGAMKKNLAERLLCSSDEFKKRIASVVTEEARHYRPLLPQFFESKEFLSLSSEARNEEILTSLDIFRRRNANGMKKESRRISRLKSEEEGYEESARRLSEQIEVQKKVALAEYVAMRKIILDRLEHLIEIGEGNKAHREAAIHDLIFAQRTDSEADYGLSHQLWIVDERLESHDYLASDQPIDGKRGDRPDLLIALNTPGAFACQPFSKAAGYERIIIVEFKQAFRELANLPMEEWPHHQMTRYANEIETGKAKHFRTKRIIDVTCNARFYMYAVCELSDAFIKKLVAAGFTKAPTGDGAFMVTNEGKYWMEYISLQKLSDDAKSRNAALFRRLGLE
jgi:hypothetical protein